LAEVYAGLIGGNKNKFLIGYWGKKNPPEADFE
jgi:hypothetical protein